MSNEDAMWARNLLKIKISSDTISLDLSDFAINELLKSPSNAFFAKLSISCPPDETGKTINLW